MLGRSAARRSGNLSIVIIVSIAAARCPALDLVFIAGYEDLTDDDEGEMTARRRQESAGRPGAGWAGLGRPASPLKVDTQQHGGVAGPASAPPAFWPAHSLPALPFLLPPQPFLSPGLPPTYSPAPGPTRPAPLHSTPLPFNISSILGTAERAGDSEDSGYLGSSDQSTYWDSELQTQAGSEEEDIDVVGLDEEEKSKIDLLIYSQSLGQQNNSEVSANSDATCEGVDVKKKMLIKSQTTKDTTTTISESFDNYRHKKIRRNSKENFVKTETDGDSNKNSNQKEKLSYSEVNSLEKDQRLKKTDKKKIKSEKWEMFPSCQRNVGSVGQVAGRRCCELGETELRDGLRILLRLGAHFYAGRLTEESPPDVYGVVIDRERGSKPHIFSRQQLLRDAVSSYQ